MYDIVALGCPKVVYMLAAVSMFVQIGILVLLAAYSFLRRKENTRKQATIAPPSEFPADLLRSRVNAVASVGFMFYIISYVISQILMIRRKPSAALASLSLAFHRRIMPNAMWSILGVIFNLQSLSICSFLALIVITVTDEPFDIVLNVLAVFFLYRPDNILVPKAQIDFARKNLEACLRRSNADTDLPVVVRSRGFSYPLKMATTLVPFVAILGGVLLVITF